MVKISPSEITPEDVYINRRQFMKLGALASRSFDPGRMRSR